jgi:hypothetical protein
VYDDGHHSTASCRNLKKKVGTFHQRSPSSSAMYNALRQFSSFHHIGMSFATSKTYLHDIQHAPNSNAIYGVKGLMLPLTGAV